MAASPRAAGGLHRKITVNERIDRILLGSMQEEDARAHGAPEARDRARERSYQLSALYSSSVEDRLLQTRARAARSRARKQPEEARAERAIPPLDIDDSDHELPRVDSVGKLASAPSSVSLAPLASQAQPGSGAQEEGSPKKPWYNTSKRPDHSPCASLDAKVRRYGAYGVAKMLACATPAGTSPPYKLRESQSLEALAPQNRADAWSSPLRGSPSLWPQDATYAGGSRLPTAMLRCASPVARFPSHSVGDVAADAHLARAKAVHKRDVRALEARLDAEKLSRRQEIEANRAALRAWHERLDFQALLSAQEHPIVRLKGQRAARQMTIVHTPEYSSESTLREQARQVREKRFALRWRNMAVLLGVMRRTPCRRPVLQDVDKLLALAYELAFRNADPLAMSRQQFWTLLQKEYPDVDARHANRLFSSYDAGMRDAVDIRAFFGTIRALRVQQGTPLDLLCASFRDFDAAKRGAIARLEDFVAALSICCGSDEEELDMRRRATSFWLRMESDAKAHGLWHKKRRELDDDAISFASVGSEASDAVASEDAANELQLAAEGRISIQRARAAIKRERALLQLYTDLLLRRREECFNADLPPSR